MGSYPWVIVAGDFNGDGWLDAATSNYGGRDVTVLINDQSWLSPPPPSIRISDMSVTETNSGTLLVGFLLTLSHASNVDVTVHYATADITATAGSDYVATSGVVTFPAGQTFSSMAVLINGDRRPELTETLAVNLSAATNATIGDPQAICTILDFKPNLTIYSTTVIEGNSGTTAMNFTLALSGYYDADVTVSFATQDRSATTGDNDYQAASGTATIAAGTSTTTVRIDANGDEKIELDETIYVMLSNATNVAGITNVRATATIRNDDAVPRISISDVSKAEGKNGKTTSFTFTVTLSAAYDQAVTMSYRTVDGTATTGDSDYVAKTGTLTFAPGETAKTITIEIKTDSKKEGNEVFYLDLFGLSSNALFSKNRGVGTIANDD